MGEGGNTEPSQGTVCMVRGADSGEEKFTARRGGGGGVLLL